MTQIILILVALAGLLTVMAREAGALAAIGVLAVTGLIGLGVDAPILGSLLLIAAALVAICGLPALRTKWLSPRLFDMFKKVSPKVSATEKVALEAGTVFWDAELFSGKPQWDTLTAQRNDGISSEEQAFIDQQCSIACGMTNSWEIARERADLPAELWEFLKREKFFGMIIPKQYGGLGFSAKAQSLVLQKLAVNETLMVTVGVPNSLGPGELLLKYGSEEQKDFYLPRLADGREIPCFGLTGPRAGSDATSIPDTGIVCRDMHEGEEVVGIRLNFEKRWITLAPVATVVGLAFRMFDPEHLLGDVEDIGISCALIPRDTDGMDIGRRHHPIGAPFMNGPIFGKDVFIPLSYLIGGQEMAGQGWKMLVECLSVGRCITLPSGSAGISRYALGWSAGFARVRRQFNLPVAEMEGVQEPLARMAAMNYISQAAVLHTANMIDNGHKPAVPSAILKSQLTEMARSLLADGMDIHGGRGVTLGPRNYIGVAYAGTPVSITVEGANIMTRNLMIFGQGAIRCHPYVLDELAAKDADDLNAFDSAFFSHAGLIFGNAARAFTQSFGIGGKASGFDAIATPYARHINRVSAAFSLSADAAMASLGASLKAREMLSARLGDVLSNLYLASLTLKQWHETEATEHEEALFHYSMQWLLHRAETALDELFANLPNRALGTILRVIALPRGRQFAMPKDTLTREIARAVSTDSALRTKLTANTWDVQDEGQQDNALARYNALLKDYPRAEPIYKTLAKAYHKGEIPADALSPEERIEAAVEAGILSGEDGNFMRTFEAEVLDMLTVDHFEFDAFVRQTMSTEGTSSNDQQNAA